jgi:hypothetical protein
MTQLHVVPRSSSEELYLHSLTYLDGILLINKNRDNFSCLLLKQVYSVVLNIINNRNYTSDCKVYASVIRCGVVVKALCHKPEGRGFETRRGEIFLNLLEPSGSFRPWGFTQPLIEISTRSIKIMFLGSRARSVRRADYLTAICEPIV